MEREKLSSEETWICEQCNLKINNPNLKVYGEKVCPKCGGILGKLW